MLDTRGSAVCRGGLIALTVCAVFVCSKKEDAVDVGVRKRVVRSTKNVIVEVMVGSQDSGIKEGQQMKM
jgi:hypothetical protein